jgi:hypothetical protein
VKALVCVHSLIFVGSHSTSHPRVGSFTSGNGSAHRSRSKLVRSHATTSPIATLSPPGTLCPSYAHGFFDERSKSIPRTSSHWHTPSLLGPLHLRPLNPLPDLKLRLWPGWCPSPGGANGSVGLRAAGDVAAVRRVSDRSDWGTSVRLALARRSEEPHWGTMW